MDGFRFSRLSDIRDISKNRQYLALVFSSVGSVVCLLTGLNAYQNNLPGLAYVLFFCTALLFSSFCIMRSNALRSFHAYTQHFAVICIITLGMYLVYTGGVANTGPLWIYVIPPVTFAFCGLYVGIFYNLLFIIMMSIVFLVPSISSELYPAEFEKRILMSYALTSMLSALYEYVRRKSFRELINLSDKYQAQSIEDQLTGLANRRGFSLHLDNEYSIMQKENNNMALLLCDIDFFKSINDRFGHSVGDLVLEHIAAVIRQTIRSTDTAARWGGEEFIVLAPKTSLSSASELAEKIRMAIKSKPFTTKDFGIPLTISIGVSCISSEQTPEDALRIADDFLYRAKEYGRDKVISA